MSEPYCLAMVLCEAAHRDTATGKVTILGTFSEFICAEYPAKVKFVVYYAITDGLGNARLKLKLKQAGTGIPGTDDENVVFAIETDISFQSPMEIYEEYVEIEFILPENGVYHCELTANESLMMSRRFIAMQKEIRNDDKNSDDDGPN